MERLYVPNKGYALMERSHTLKYLGTWTIMSVFMRGCTREIASALAPKVLPSQPLPAVQDYGSVSKDSIFLHAHIEFVHPMSVECSHPSLIRLYFT